MGRDRHDGDMRAVAVEQAVYQMQVAGAAAACTDGEFACDMRFATGREGRDLLVPGMNPLDSALPA